MSSPKVCVIYGGTEVPIDSVRKISNFSSGTTGAVIASYLQNRDCQVTVLRAKSAVPTSKEDLIFTDFNSLKQNSLALLDGQTFDTVIMLAAVSDYEVEKVFVDGQNYPVGRAKIPSNRKLMLELRPTEKLINYYAKITKPRGSQLIAFKLTSGADQETIEKRVKSVFQAGVDGVIHNDLAFMSEKIHPFTFYYNRKKIVGETKQEMAQRLYEVMI